MSLRLLDTQILLINTAETLIAQLKTELLYVDSSYYNYMYSVVSVRAPFMKN